MSRTADSEAQIETLIEQAGNRLRQQLDTMHRDEMHRDNDSADSDSRDFKPLHRRPPDPRERLPWWRWLFK
jgi:hypothetical protein